MTHRASLLIPMKVWVDFKSKAGRVYKYGKGYTSKGATDAMRMWLELDKTHEGCGDLLKIARKKYPNLKEEELVKKVFEECKALYLEKNKDYL